MNRLSQLWFVCLSLFIVSGCGVYSPYGAQTSGAKTFHVVGFNPVNPLASASSALLLTELMRDRIQRQSTLRLQSDAGELRFEADIVQWAITPVNVQGGEVAASNRLTIGIVLRYENSLDPTLSFERKFSRFSDYSSSIDLFSIEEELVEEIGEQLTQDVFNATLGNW
jgi:hypothetical protein